MSDLVEQRLTPRQTETSVAAGSQLSSVSWSHSTPWGQVGLQSEPIAVAATHLGLVEGHNFYHGSAVHRWLHEQVALSHMASGCSGSAPSSGFSHHDHHPYNPHGTVRPCMSSISDSCTSGGGGGGLSTMTNRTCLTVLPSLNYLPQDSTNLTQTFTHHQLSPHSPSSETLGRGFAFNAFQERGRHIDAGGCSLSPLLTKQDCASIVLQKDPEQRGNFSDDDSGWDLGPGDPWSTPVSMSS